MSKTIVGLIAEKQASEAVLAVKKALAKKVVQSISEAKSIVARKAYGSLVEFYGADEQPDYMNDSDNAYALFFANALKKFGVSGPEDFKDDMTKQRFFDYVDHNWRAQDTVQTPISNATTPSNMERGTQTQLPAPAAPPQAPTAPSQSPTPTTAQGNDPSVATMAPAGPSIDKTAPLDQSGQDSVLNNVQNSQAFGGMNTGGGADQYGNAGVPQNMAQNDACPYCKGSGKAVCPTCNRPHGLDNQQQPGGGMGGDLDQDPDLEIGPEGSDDDSMGEEPLAGDDENSVADGQFGDEEGDGLGGGGMGGDEQSAVPGAEDEDTDDPFDDEDAFSIDASDFNNGGQASGDEDGMGGDEDGMNGNEDGDENGFGGQGEDDDDLGDDDEDGNEDGSFGGGDQGAQFAGNGDDDEEDPDLEIGGDDKGDSDEDDDESGFGGDEDDDQDEDDESDDEDSDEEPQQKVPFGEALKVTSYSRKERKPASKKKTRSEGKKQVRIAEDFGFGLDEAEDSVFIAEAMMQASVDPALNKIITYVQDQLNRIKKMRNTMLMQLRRQRAVLKKDPALGPEEKMEAMKQLATMAKDNRKFFKSQAKLVKAIFTGHLNGDGDGDMGGGDDDMGQDMGHNPGDEQQGNFPPKKGGFSPQGGDEDGGDMDQDVDPDQDGDNDMDPSGDTDQDFGGDDSGDDDSDNGFDGDDDGGDDNIPAKKSSFPPKKDKGGFPPKKKEAPVEENEKFGMAQKMPTFAELKKKKFGNAGMHQAHIPLARPVKEGLESKIKMLHMQIATQDDPTGKRKQALRNLEEQLKK